MGPPGGLLICSLPSTVLTLLGEPGQAAAGFEAGAAGAIVADPHPQQPRHVDCLHRGMPGAAVLGDVGEQFRRAEVGDGLDRGRRTLGQVDDQLDRQVAARGEGGERGAEAVVEHRRVDAAGQVAQLGDGLLGAAVGGVDQLQDPLQVGLRGPGERGPGDRAAELLPGQAQLHRDGDHLSLRAVVQVPLDPAQPRGRVVHHAGPGLLQLTHPADAVLLQAVDGPEDQRRPRQRQRRQPGQRPQPADGSEQKDAKDDVEDASGNSAHPPKAGGGGIPMT